MFEGMTPPRDKSKCIVTNLAADLSQEDQQILEQALSDPRWSTHALHKELKARGFAVGETALRRHREKECLCAE